MATPTQFTLPVSLEDSVSLDNFLLPDGLDASLLTQLQNIDLPVLYLYGSTGSGVSHLLMSSVRQGSVCDQYLPMAELLGSEAAVLQSIPLGGVIAIDDLECLNELSENWCEALFDLYHRQLDAGGVMRFGAHVAPQQLQIPLADLRSRILSGPVWALPAPDETQVKKVLEARAHARGFEMSDAVLSWLLTRETRNLGHLMQLLEKLDRMTLQQRRRLTVPFLAEWLGDQNVEE